MSRENNITAKVYKEKAYMYLDNSAEHDRLDKNRADDKRNKLEELIKESLSSLKTGAKVFEIGCGEGANSKFIKTLGFEVTASDVAKDFIESTKNKGIKTIMFDAVEDEFDQKYSAVFCWRVFVHFTKEDALTVINKVYDALEDGGVFIFNAINRENKKVDDEWVDFEGEYHMGVERYYSYFLSEELDAMIAKSGFKIQKFYKDGGKENNKWLIYILKK